MIGVGKAKRAIEFKRELSFGVEIEISDLNLTKAQLAQAIKAVGLKAKVIDGVEHANYDEWKIERDGSLYGPNAMEIVSPVLKGVAGLRELEMVCEILNDNGAKVNVGCGVHVHHEAKDLDLNQLKNVYRIYAKHERAIDEIFPQSRFNNRYAKLINGTFEQAYKHPNILDGTETVIQVVEKMDTVDQMKKVLGGEGSYQYYRDERYYKVNFVSWVNHGTLEFRQHAGSTDYEKLSNWIIATHKIIETAQFAKKISPKRASRVAKCEPDDAYVHRNYDLYMELGLNATEVASFIGKRNQELRKRGLGRRGIYQV